MKRLAVIGAGIAAAAFLGGNERKAFAAFDGDLVPRLSGTEIVTDGISDEDGSTKANVLTYQYTLGELSPGYTEDPGFQPQEGSGLPGESFLGFNTLGALLYWDGEGVPDFEPVQSGAQIEFYLGPFNTFVGGNSGAKDGFVLQEVTSTGAGHRHLNAQLLGVAKAGGSYSDSLGGSYDAPPDGIYALEIQVTDSIEQTTDPATYLSGPRYLIYNQNESDETLTTGADALDGTLAPEPGTLGVMALGMGMLMKRRRY